jgi:hypothetical protein
MKKQVQTIKAECQSIKIIRMTPLTLAINSLCPASEHYTTIAGFFSAHSRPMARKHLRKLLVAALAPKACRYNPSDVLWFYENLEALTMAALAIHQSGVEHTDAIIDLNGQSPQLSDQAHYCGSLKRYEAWHYLPRFLSEKEYGNPYRVFKKLALFSGTEGWRCLFHELRDFTFYNTSFSENTDYNTVKLYTLLGKLIEAAHLLTVRLNQETDASQPGSKR